MSFSTVLIIAFAAGVVLVVGGGLMVYMSNLVRSAYEIKVQINTEVEEKLSKMAEDLDKKSRWIKRDLLEEIEKIKVALQTDNARKIAELSDPLMKRLEALETSLRGVQSDVLKAIDADRQSIAALDQKVKALRPQAKKEEAKPEPAAQTMDETTAILAAQASVNAMGAAAAPAAPAEPTPPAKPKGPTPIMHTLQELG